MKMMKFKYISILAGFLFMAVACETTELDLADNPNELGENQSDANLLLNSIQIDFGRFVELMGLHGGQVTRIDYMDGRNYQNAYTPAAFNGEWSAAYQSTGAVFAQEGFNYTVNGILADVRAMTPLAEEQGFLHHIAIGQAIEAYTIVTLVDFFGDVPYSEALQKSDNLNPKVDPGAEIYDAALQLLDQAIANFGQDVSTEPVDFYYEGDWEKWIKFSNTLKMKIYLQRRLVDPTAIDSFNAIVATGNFITETEEDLQFQWGANVLQPDSRHPRYGNTYKPGGADEYMSNWLMNYMLTTEDPRMLYYFFRQTNAVPGEEILPDEETIECSLESAPAHYVAGNHIFCSLPTGYWGRDHGDDDGIPPDGFLRTIYGVYPAGGRFDDSSFEGGRSGQGGQGAGITPILLASWVDFMRAEIALEEGNIAGAKMLMESGITKSVSKVRSFINLDTSADREFVPSETTVTDHLMRISEAYDSAADDAERLDVIAQQYWVSMFGNGIDAYNFYRRTGAPRTLQPNIESSPGRFIRSFFYPADFVTNNASVTQKSDTNVKVFWDTNPDSPAFPVAN